MASRYTVGAGPGLHPLHAILVASVLPLLLGALLSDLAYGSTYQIQWKNFASWLIAGGLVFVGLALLWSVIELLRADTRRDLKGWLYPLLLLATFAVGFVNALVHAKDAWSSMPAGTILSAIALLLTIVALWAAFARRRVQS